MKKISASIPAVIRNIELKKQVKKKTNKENEDTSSSIVIFQHNNLIEARWPISHIAAKFPYSVLDEQSFC